MDSKWVSKENELHKGLSRFWTNQSEKNALIIGLSMFLVFVAFSTAQNFETSANGNAGAISLAILYIVYSIGSLIVPNIINNHISPKYAMFWGSVTYALFVASNIKVYIPILYIASAIIGIGAGFLWVGEGVLMTQCANQFEREHNLPLNSEIGYFNGIFWGIYQFNQLIGNLLAALLFKYGISKSVVYVVLTTINFVATLGFLLIKPFDNIYTYTSKLHKQHKNKDVKIDPLNQLATVYDASNLLDNQHTGTTNISPDQDDDCDHDDVGSTIMTSKIEIDSLLVIKMWLMKPFWVIVGLTIYTGIMQTFEYGQFATLINGNANKFFSLAMFGFFDAIASTFFGKISDRISRLYIIFVAILCHGFVYIYLLIFYKNGNIQIVSDKNDLIESNLYIWLIVGAFLGVGDAGFNTQMWSLYPILLGDKPESFANLNCWQSLACAFAFSWQDYVSLNTKLITYLLILILSVVPLYYTKLARQAASSKKSNTTRNNSD